MRVFNLPPIGGLISTGWCINIHQPVDIGAPAGGRLNVRYKSKIYSPANH